VKALDILTVVSPARSLKALLRRELAPPKDGVRLLLRPESTPENRYLEHLQGSESKLPPCRVVWIGDLKNWGVLHVAALVERPVSQETFATTWLSVGSLRNGSVGRVLSERQIDHESSGSYANAGPSPKFAANCWQIDLWFGGPDTVTVTAEEVPSLAIATLAGHPRFASSPLYVVADRAAKRIVVIPSWEIFRYYYARSDRVAWATFGFPTWSPATLRDLLEGFDGHEFADRRRWSPPAPEEAVRTSEPWRYAGERLVAIGRDTVVGYAVTGRAHIRALPPFRGSARLLTVAVATQLGAYAALFVQNIVESTPGECEPGVIRWTPAPG
jgi:hypothetical protein